MGSLCTTVFVASVTLISLAPAGKDAPDQVDAAADETRDLFDTAASEYETSQYNRAVETYTRAYRRSVAIADEELRGLVQAAILFNLARAHVKAYALDEDPDHLLQAVDLLDKYLAQTADLADQLDAEQLLEQARDELARLEQLEREQEAAAAPPPAVEDARPRKRGLQAAGYTLLGLGIAGGGVGIAGAVLAAQARDAYAAGPTRDDRDQAERTGLASNTMIIAGAASAGVLVVTGVALLIADRKRSRAITPTAWLTPSSAGVAIGGSF